MKKLLFVFCLLALPVTAQDSWRGADKKMHFGVSGAFGIAAISQYPNEPWRAWGLAMIPGLLKELSDASKGGTGFSYKDMVANALGAGFGITMGRWLVKHDGIFYRSAF